MAKYKYDDIIRALNTANYFAVNNNGGSHQVYKNNTLGLSQPVPKHSSAEVKSGTAESILDYVILAARIQNINIVRDRYKLTDDIKKYIIKRHAEIKNNIIALIPADIRKQQHIETFDEGQRYINDLSEKHKVFVKKQENEAKL